MSSRQPRPSPIARIGKSVAALSPGRSLSGKLLLLTVAFVLLAEILIYVPSIARFRHAFLLDKLNDAYLAVTAMEVAPDIVLAEEIGMRLLDRTGTQVIAARELHGGRAQGPRRIIARALPKAVDASFDLADPLAASLIMDAFETLLVGDGRIIRVRGMPSMAPATEVDLVFEEAQLRAAMLRYSVNILWLSLVIAGVSGALLMLAISFALVRPIRRLADGMAAFRERPEDPATTVAASGRGDELGLAERELARMQEELRAALVQRTRLASIGLAVAKFNHDLRNILSTALLAVDGLAATGDARTQRQAQTAAEAIERAAQLCARSLRFARDGTPEVSLAPVLIETVMAAVQRSLPSELAARIDTKLPSQLTVLADEDHLFRVLANLCRNALEAGARQVTVTAASEATMLVLEIADDGSGIPDSIEDHLFQPFRGSSKPGGSGLGLAIARDLARAMNGDLTLADTGPAGTRFRLSLPAVGGRNPRSEKEGQTSTAI